MQRPAVCRYLQQMQLRRSHCSLACITYTLGAFMLLDESTRRNLELTETIRGGDAKGSLLAVLDATLTPMGGRLLRRWINQPLLDVDGINRRLDAVQCCVDDTVLRLDARGLLGRSVTWSAGPTVCCRGSASPRDLVDLAESLRAAPRSRR